MNRQMRVALFFSVSIFMLVALCLKAQWRQVDIPVCTDESTQRYPSIASDGFGGAIISWDDSRNWDVYAQRLDSMGYSLWTSCGINISEQSYRQRNSKIVADSSGAAIIAYEGELPLSPLHVTKFHSRIYARKIAPDGTPGWRITVSDFDSQPVDEISPVAMSDGSGGVIIAWHGSISYYMEYPCQVPLCIDYFYDYNIYAQRIDADGNRLWGNIPVFVCDAAEDQLWPQMITDGSGGLILTWIDKRSGNNDIYAQRIDAHGNIMWEDNGVPVCVYEKHQLSPSIAQDGTGGFFITWRDYRYEEWEIANIYAQRLDSLGNSLWMQNGLPVCSADGEKSELAIVSSASGSCIISWTDWRSGVPSIYAQRVDTTGNKLWSYYGECISTSEKGCRSLRIIPDGNKGAVIAWEEKPFEAGQALRGIWGTTSNEIFTVGENGVILQYDGSSWNRMESGTSTHLFDVWASSGSDVFVVGGGGKILYYDGISWSKMNSGTNVDLRGVWGSSSDDVYAVGIGGTMLHYDGCTWSQMDLCGGVGHLYDVAGNSSTNVYAVGSAALRDGIILHYNGISWSKTKSYYEEYTSVWISQDNNIFIAGHKNSGDYKGFIKYYDGSNWNTKFVDCFYPPYSGIWGSCSDNVYVVFYYGNLLHYDGSKWESPSKITSYILYNIWGTAGDDIYVVGEPLAVRHLERSNWVTQTALVNNIFIQRVGSTGTRLWTDRGVPVSESWYQQLDLSLAHDENGYALLAWSDFRNDKNWDIYARKISIQRGPTVAILLLYHNAEVSECGITVTWELSEYNEEIEFHVFRALGHEGNSWVRINPEIIRNDLQFKFCDTNSELGESYRYRVHMLHESSEQILFETEPISMPLSALTLYQNHPNPFNPKTTITYYLPKSSHVVLNIYDVSGRKIRSLVNEYQEKGKYELIWDGTDQQGNVIGSGVYFCRMLVGKESISKKMILLK